MWLRGLLALVGLAACDQVYGLHRPEMFDAPITQCAMVEDPAADSDGDTVPDGQDTCPTIAEVVEVMHNEDDDCDGDACDLCPHIAGFTDEDLDGDKIGAKCDLDATVDNTAQFEGFDNLDEFIQIGVWNPASNADTLTNNSDAISIAFLNEPTPRLFRIDTTIDLLATDGDWYAGIVLGANQPELNQLGYFVALRRTAGAPIRLGLYTLANSNFQPLVPDQSAELAEGSSVLLRMFVQSSTIRVESVVDGTTIGSANFSIPIALGSDTYYGPATKGPVRAAFRYLWHVQ